MGVIDLNSVAAIGAVRDVPSYMLPPEAWNLALNMRIVDQGLEKLSGWESIFGTPTVVPHFLLPVATQSAQFWAYASLTKVYVWNGSTHTNITRQTAAVDVDYTAANGYDWNGALLAGVAILNNGADVPQMWSPTAVATKLVALTNWPAGLRAKVVRSLGPFLIAFNLTDSGSSLPHTVQWSHPADPGSVPSSWDYTDPTKDAGRSDRSDTQAGVIQDALPLGSTMYIYKENSVHRMNFVGGRQVFDFGESAWLPSIGLLAPRSVAITNDGTRHVWATQDDIKWHNGSSVESILNETQRRRLYNEIDTTHFLSSFMFDNPFQMEMWFCYPGAGQSFPDRALVLNYSDPQRWRITEADGLTFRHAAQGAIQSASDELWSDNPTELWSDDTGPWSTLSRRRVLVAGTADTKIFNFDKGTTRNTVAFTGTLRREGLSILGQNRQGGWIVDHQIEKMIHRLWPKVQGGPINVRVGAAATVNGATSWGDSVAFNPAIEDTADILPVCGRANAVEFSGTASWRLDGYKLEVEAVGASGVIQP